MKVKHIDRMLIGGFVLAVILAVALVGGDESERSSRPDTTEPAASTEAASVQVDVAGWKREIRSLDPDTEVILRLEHIGSGVGYVYVADSWYALQCYQRQRFAKSMRAVWKKHGGLSVVLFDKAGTEVADFQVFSDDFDVRGCDN